MRATCEFSQSKEALTLPPIKVKIFKTKHDITIKISDLGGGIPRELSGKVFNYMYSTAPKVINWSDQLVNSRSGPGARHYNSFFWRLTFLRAEAHMVPASPLRTSPCTASDTASLCPGCTRAISWATSDRKCWRTRDQCVRLPPEAVPHGPGEHPRVQRQVQRQAQERGDAGCWLDRWQEVLEAGN